MAYLFETAEKSRCKVVLPMPAVAEYLAGADMAGVESLNLLERKTCILLGDFNRAAAFECAQLDRAAMRGSEDKKDGSDAPWQKVKIDRQIVAIAKANGAGLVISRDKGVRNNALRVGMSAIKVEELELPMSARQGKLALVEPEPRAATGKGQRKPTLTAVPKAGASEQG
ncbi:hypothetical protein SAMN05444680_10517 [Variovorax sp. YR216]|nr:hypothetical protein SAMN05444680_10517 [Variovorax sp. YR216]